MGLPATHRKLVAARLTSDFRAAAEVREVPLVPPGPGQIVARNRLMGVNGSDPVATTGGYGITEVPFDLGLDSGGEVVAVGEGVEGVAVGDEVLMFGFGGGYGEYRLIAADQAYVVDAATPALTGAFIPALTASVAFGETGVLRSGETVLVTAAAGGVGSYAVQLAKRAGNHVVGTTGSEAKAAWLREIGCDRVVNHRAEPLEEVLARDYPGGVDVVFETVGRDTFDTALRHLAPFGRLLSIGATAEYVDGVRWERVEAVRIYQTLLARSATLAGSTLAMYPRRVWRDHLARIIAMLAAGELRPVLDETAFYGLEAVPDAVAHLQAGRNRGKVLVRA